MYVQDRHSVYSGFRRTSCRLSLRFSRGVCSRRAGAAHLHDQQHLTSHKALAEGQQVQLHCVSTCLQGGCPRLLSLAYYLNKQHQSQALYQNVLQKLLLHYHVLVKLLLNFSLLPSPLNFSFPPLTACCFRGCSFQHLHWACWALATHMHVIR